MIFLNLSSKNKLLFIQINQLYLYIEQQARIINLNKGGMSHVFIYILWDLPILNQIKLNHQERSLFHFPLMIPQ